MRPYRTKDTTGGPVPVAFGLGPEGDLAPGTVWSREYRVRLPAELNAWVQSYATATETAVPSLLRQALVYYLKDVAAGYIPRGTGGSM